MSLKDIDTRKLRFISDSMSRKRDLELTMAKCFAKFDWPIFDNKVCEVMLASSLNNLRMESSQMTKSWKANVIQTFRAFVETIEVKSFTFDSAVSKQLLHRLTQLGDNDQVTVIPGHNEKTLDIIGPTPVPRLIKDTIEIFISDMRWLNEADSLTASGLSVVAHSFAIKHFHILVIKGDINRIPNAAVVCARETSQSPNTSDLSGILSAQICFND